MSTTRYKKRRCADCDAPVNQRVADADAGKTAYCHDHALGRAVAKMNQGFADLEPDFSPRLKPGGSGDRTVSLKLSHFDTLKWYSHLSLNRFHPSLHRRPTLTLARVHAKGGRQTPATCRLFDPTQRRLEERVHTRPESTCLVYVESFAVNTDGEKS